MGNMPGPPDEDAVGGLSSCSLSLLGAILGAADNCLLEVCVGGRVPGSTGEETWFLTPQTVFNTAVADLISLGLSNHQIRLKRKADSRLEMKYCSGVDAVHRI